MSSRASRLKYEIYLSCERKSEPAVLKLYNKLSNLYDLMIWFAAVDAANSKDDENYLKRKAIAVSEIFVCCLTTRYIDNRDCLNECILAHSYKMPGIILLMEPDLLHHFPTLKFAHDWPKINMYETCLVAGEFKNWTGMHYNEFLDRIEDALEHPLIKHRDELDDLFHQMQSAFDKTYERKWRAIEQLPFRLEDPVVIDMELDGSMKVGGMIKGQYKQVANQLGNRGYLKWHFSNDKDLVWKFLMLMDFCWQYIGTTANDVVGTEYQYFFRVINGDPIVIELVNSKKRFTIEQVAIKYFKYIAKAAANKLKYRTNKVTFMCPSKYSRVFENINFDKIFPQ